MRAKVQCYLLVQTKLNKKITSLWFTGSWSHLSRTPATIDQTLALRRNKMTMLSECRVKLKRQPVAFRTNGVLGVLTVAYKSSEPI